MKSTIYESNDLMALLNYIFFKINSSAINARIVSYIYDSDGFEVYTEVDEIIVETRGSFVKSFDSLNLPNGEYMLRVQVYYGETKDAVAEEMFWVKNPPLLSVVGQSIVFVTVVGLAFIFVRWKRRGRGAESR